MSLPDVRAALEQEWAEFKTERNAQGKLTQAENWRRANPGEWHLLSVYRAGGERPVLFTSMGKQMVEHVDAYHLTAEQAPVGVVKPKGPLVPRTGALFLRDGDGALTEKIEITSSLDYGFGNQRWYGGTPDPLPPPSTGTWVLRDCVAHNVSANPPRSMDGTGEVGFQVGEKTQGDRLEAYACAWMGMVTLANCRGSVFRNVNLHDNPHVGLYMEHVSEDILFEDCWFGFPDKGTTGDAASINVEWAYRDGIYAKRMPEFGGIAGSRNCTFRRCHIYCPLPLPNSPKPYEVAGAFLDAGPYGFLFDQCTFYGPGDAHGFPTQMLDPSKPNRAVNCTYLNAGRRGYTHDNGIGR